MGEKGVKFAIAMMFSTLAIAAIVFSIMAVSACDFVTYMDDKGETKMAGLFKFEVPGEGDQRCVTYTDGEVNSLSNLEKSAMVCGFLAPCFAIVALALATVELFLCDRCCVGLFVSILFSFATIAQCLTFMFLKSPSFCRVTGCNVGYGAIYSTVAVSVMFVSGCTLGCIPKSEPLLMPRYNRR